MSVRPAHQGDKVKNTEYIICPFCKEGDFDLVGLKMHIERGWCEEYEGLA